MKRKKPVRQSLEDNLAELLAWVKSCDQDRLNCDVKTEVGQDGKKYGYTVKLKPVSEKSLDITIELFDRDVGFYVSSYKTLRALTGLKINEKWSHSDFSWWTTEDILTVSSVIGVCQCLRDARAIVDILVLNGSKQGVRAIYPTETSPTASTHTGWPMFMLPLLRLFGRAEIVRLDYEPW